MADLEDAIKALRSDIRDLASAIRKTSIEEERRERLLIAVLEDLKAEINLMRTERERDQRFAQMQNAYAGTGG